MNNLKNEERAGFVEAKLGMDLLILLSFFSKFKLSTIFECLENVRCEISEKGSISLNLGVNYNDKWLQGGSIKIPAATASVEDGFSATELAEQQKFLRLHDKRTRRLKFIWHDDEKLKRDVSMKR